MSKTFINKGRWVGSLNLLMVSALMLASNNWAAPSPLEDEAFLLFLADTFEEEDGLIDPLSMTDKDQEITVKIESEVTQTIEKAQQEDKNVN